MSRAGTPKIEAGSTAGNNTQNEGGEEKNEGGKDGEKKEASEDKISDDTEKPPELPIEVRSKLRRLDKIESRYHGMQLSPLSLTTC